MVTRGDLALAALLDGHDDDARKYLAYTGAGRFDKSPFDTASVIDAPACGGENGLRPEDSAVIQFNIDDDGTVGFAEPIYASRHGDAAAVFAREVADWSWKPEKIADIPYVQRATLRVEIRCTNAISRPAIIDTFRSALASWLSDQGVAPFDADDDAMPVASVRSELARREHSGNALAPVPALVALSEHPFVEYDERKTFAERARTLVLAHDPSLMAQLYFDVTAREHDDDLSVRDYRDSLRQLMRRPDVMANAEAAAALRLLVSQSYPGSDAPDDRALLLRQVTNDARLQANDPLRINALVRLAGAEAEEGDLDAARASYERTGLTAQQCALVDATPALRHDNSSSADFPREALQWGFEGWVTTEFDIQADGQTAAQRALIAYPPFVFDDAATGILKRARYEQSYRPEGALGCGGARQRVRFQQP